MKRFLIIYIFFFSIQISHGQDNVGIGTTTPHSSAILDVQSSTKGVLFPRMTTTQRVALVAVEGLLAFDTTTKTFWYYDGSNWIELVAGSISEVVAGNGLLGGGNSGSVILNVQGDNGLNVNTANDAVELGGALNKVTQIDHNSFDITHNLNGSGDFAVRDAGVDKFTVHDNGRVAIGRPDNFGAFNVTGNSIFSDDMILRDGLVTSGDYLIRLHDVNDDGVIDVYRNGSVTNRINGNGSSYFTGGNVGIGISVPLQALHVFGTGRFSTLAGVGSRMVVADANGDLSTQAIPTSGIGGVIAGNGLIGGGSTGTPTVDANVNNGIKIGTDAIQLGGSLNQVTTINHGSYDLNHNLNAGGDFAVRDNGVDKFVVHDNGKVAVGSQNNLGAFNVTGNSYYTDDLILRDASITTGDFLVRLHDQDDDGLVDVYQNGVVKNRLHGNGNSYVTGGNLGVGTTTPAQQLHVDGTARFSDLAGTGSRVVIADANGDLMSSAVTTIGDITEVIAGDGLSGGSSVGSSTLDVEAGNGLLVNAGTDQVEMGGTLNRNTNINLASNELDFRIGSAGEFSISDGNGIVPYLKVTPSGTVNIGSISSGKRLFVQYNTELLQDFTMFKPNLFSPNDTMVHMSYGNTSGTLQLYQNNVPTIRMNALGTSYFMGEDVGIGTTTPIAKFAVRQGIGGKPAIYAQASATSGNSTGIAAFNTLDNSLGTATGVEGLTNTINSKTTYGVLGNVIGQSVTGMGVGAFVNSDNITNAYALFSRVVNSDPGDYAGYFSGNVYSTGSYLPSFQGLKKNIQSTTQSAVANLMELDIKQYDFKTDEFPSMNLPRGRQTGIMSDNIGAVFPELVQKVVQPGLDEDDENVEFEAVNYTGLIPHMIKGTQEQEEKIKSLNAKVIQLEQRVKDLEQIDKRLNSLEALLSKK